MDGLTDGRTDAGNDNTQRPKLASGNKRAPLLYYIKLCASFHSHGWIQTGVTVRKHSIRVKISIFFLSCDLEIWQMTMKNYRAPLLCCFRLCASFHSHWWIQTGVTVRKRPIWVKINNSFLPCNLEIWRMTLRNDRAPLLSNIKLCVSFYHHKWILPWVTVQKRPNCFFDLWPWHLTYDLDFFMDVTFVIAITRENFIMIRWWKHSGVTDGWTDGLNHS